MSARETTTSGLYQPLSREKHEIRLVTIVSGPSPTSTIECKLSTFSLADAPPYAALSYVWGDTSQTAPIILNDAGIPVTTNLLAALRQMSVWDIGIYLWIDALCINQSDTKEKSHQVSLMRHIFQQAKFVIMWLGLEKDDSDLAISMIEEWGTAYINVDKNLRVKSRVAVALAMLNDPSDEASWKAMTLFLQRPYWNRIWIVQEMALSRHALIACGNAVVESFNFWAALGLWSAVTQPEMTNLVSAEQQMTIVSSGYRRIAELIVVRGSALLPSQRDTPFATRLHQYILATRHHLASDPRDKVFGLLGLIDESHEEYIPDYNKDVVQVYTDLVVHYLHATNKFASTYLEGIGFLHENRIPGLPSWVPDFSNTIDSRFQVFSYIEAGMPGFSSAEETTAQISFSEDFTLLTAVGIIVDEISDIEPKRLDICSENPGRHLLRWLRFTAALCLPIHPTGMPWRQVFFRTAVGDNSGYGYGKSEFRNDKLRDFFYGQVVGFLWFFGLEPGRNGLRLPEAFRGCASVKEGLQRIDELHPDEDIAYFVKLFLLCDERFVGPILGDGDAESLRQTLLDQFCGQPDAKCYLDSFVSRFSDTFRRKIHGLSFVSAHLLSAQRRLFVTKDGYMGIASMGAQKGDRICVLLGCDVPLIIRPAGDDYLVIGDTYIYGMMNGEVMQGVRDGKHRCEELRFR